MPVGGSESSVKASPLMAEWPGRERPVGVAYAYGALLAGPLSALTAISYPLIGPAGV
jgi:hypothetical protein